MNKAKTSETELNKMEVSICDKYFKVIDKDVGLDSRVHKLGETAYKKEQS